MRGRVRASTYEGYEVMLRLHAGPALGERGILIRSEVEHAHARGRIAVRRNDHARSKAVLGRRGHHPLLAGAGWTIYPIFVVPYARVKLQDEIGALLQARHALMLLGERPGLGSPDSQPCSMK